MTNTKTTTTKTKTTHTKEIESIYFSLVRIMESASHLDDFMKAVIKDERKHRSFRPSTISGKFGLTVKQAAQYFVCKWILEAKTSKPEVKEYLHTKKEVFTGYSIYKMYEKEIKENKVFNKTNTEVINSFDYAEYI